MTANSGEAASRNSGVLDVWIDAATGPLARGLAGLENESRDIHLAPRVAAFRVELRLLAAYASHGAPLAAPRSHVDGCNPRSRRFLFLRGSGSTLVARTGCARRPGA